MGGVWLIGDDDGTGGAREKRVRRSFFAARTRVDVIMCRNFGGRRHPRGRILRRQSHSNNPTPFSRKKGVRGGESVENQKTSKG